MIRKIAFYITEVIVCYMSFSLLAVHAMARNGKLENPGSAFFILLLYIGLFAIAFYTRYNHFSCTALKKNDKFFLWAFLSGIYLIFATLLVTPTAYDLPLIALIAIIVLWKEDVFELFLCGSHSDILGKQRKAEIANNKAKNKEANTASAKIRYCKKCGKNIDEDSAYCRYCGESQE